MTPSEFLYKFEEGKLDDEVCVSLTTNEDGSCPIEFPISILLNITNLLGTYVVLVVFLLSL